MDGFLAFATKLAHEAGAVMLQHFQIGVKTETKAHEGNTPVTIADKAINQLVIDAVRSAYPSHSVLGEEQSIHIEGAPFIWVCDPIDGTIPYSAGVPTNVFSLALVDSTSGLPVAAVVYDPYMKRLYTAIKGRGAFVNETRLHVNRTALLKDAMIGASAQRSKVVNSTQLKAAIIGNCFRQLSLNSTIYESMLVASGQLAAQAFVGFTAHDVATSKLIVEEAGGKVTDIFGDSQRYDQEVRGCIASNGLVHDELTELAHANSLEALGE